MEVVSGITMPITEKDQPVTVPQAQEPNHEEALTEATVQFTKGDTEHGNDHGSRQDD